MRVNFRNNYWQSKASAFGPSPICVDLNDLNVFPLLRPASKGSPLSALEYGALWNVILDFFRLQVQVRRVPVGTIRIQSQWGIHQSRPFAVNLLSIAAFSAGSLVSRHSVLETVKENESTMVNSAHWMNIPGKR